MVFEDAHPFFQVVRPNTQNNHDIDSPHGVSIFNGMTSYFVNSDILFDLYQNESLNNKTRVIVKSDLTQTKLVVDESTGDVQYINYLDDQDTAIVSYPMENNDNQPAVQFFQGKLQFDQIGLALDKVVKFTGWRAGLGKNFYTFNEGGVNYQNEKSVITSNNDTYRTKKKHETLLREAILGMIKAILQLESLNGNYTSDIAKEEIDIIFDDSIVTNDEEIKADIFMLAEKGMIPKWRVVSHVMKMNEDDAKALVGEALADITAEQSRFMESYEDDDEGIDGDNSGQVE
jgi:A118 family predicted phage portal protein